MKSNIKMLVLAVVSGIMLTAASASAHKCEFPKDNAECKGKTIANNHCTVKMENKDCSKKGGKMVKNKK